MSKHFQETPDQLDKTVSNSRLFRCLPRQEQRPPCVELTVFVFEQELLDVCHNLQVRFVKILLVKRNVSFSEPIVSTNYGEPYSRHDIITDTFGLVDWIIERGSF